MAWWRLRNPATFPYPFHDAMADGVGEDKVAFRHQDESGIIAAAKQWRLFCYSLRHHPMHPLHAFAVKFKHRTSRRWNPEVRMWELLVTTRRSVMEDIEEMS